MLVIMSVGALRAETVLRRVAAPYAAVRSVSCEMRRDTPLPGGATARMLSRVHFERGDRMHVETTAPLRRRIVCDGAHFRMHLEGEPRGYGVPVADLPDDMLGNLRSVPGSPDMALRQLEGVQERALPASDAFPVRAGYDNGKTFTVLSLDEQSRLAQIEVFAAPDMLQRIARTVFSSYREVLPGVWFACVQRTEAVLRGKERTETLRIGNLIVNGDLPASLFNPDAFFENIVFVDSIGAPREP
jgi:hypothetical protein